MKKALLAVVTMGTLILAGCGGGNATSNISSNSTGVSTTNNLKFIDNALKVSGSASAPKYTIKILSTTNNVWSVDAQTSKSITKAQAEAIADKVLKSNWGKYDGIMITVEYVKKSKINGKTLKQFEDVHSWKAARTSVGAKVEGLGSLKVPFIKAMN